MSFTDIIGLILLAIVAATAIEAAWKAANLQTVVDQHSLESREMGEAIVRMIEHATRQDAAALELTKQLEATMHHIVAQEERLAKIMQDTEERLVVLEGISRERR